jgi:hypothetical protein
VHRRDPRRHELHERVDDVLHIGVDVEMVGLDVEHDRHRGREREERPIVFVGLHHVRVERPRAEVAPPRANASARHASGIEAGRGKRVGGHHRGGRLAVRARHRHQRAAAHSLTERLGAADHGQSERTRRHELRMRGGHRRRIHDGTRASHERRIVRVHADTERDEIGRTRRVRIGALHVRTATYQQLGEAAHAGPGNAHEVYGSGISWIEQWHQGK